MIQVIHGEIWGFRKQEIFAILLDESDSVITWIATPLWITYWFDGKIRRYYPDFLINGNVLVEVKSGYVYGLFKERHIAKHTAALQWANNNGYDFVYLQFDEKNLTLKKVKNDLRVVRFLLGRD